MQQRGPRSWRLKVFLGRDGNDQRRYLERTVSGTRRDAEKELARLVVEVDDGRHVASAPMTFGELLNRWLALKATTVEATTVEGYRWIVDRYARPTFGERKVASIRTLELDDWYQSLRSSGGAGGAPLSGRTVRICHTVMRQSLGQARKWGLIARNPAIDATPPAAARAEVSPPTVEQVRLLLASAFEFDPDFGVYLWVLASTGCRRGEGCALRWRDVDWERGQLAIRALHRHGRRQPGRKGHEDSPIETGKPGRVNNGAFTRTPPPLAGARLAVRSEPGGRRVPVLGGSGLLAAVAARRLHQLVRPPTSSARSDDGALA